MKRGANVKNPKGPNSAVDVDFQKALAELQAAVKAGTLTKEQVVERINALKKAKQEK